MKTIKLIEKVLEALTIEGEHHKQWYLEEILIELTDIHALREEHGWEKGIAP